MTRILKKHLLGMESEFFLIDSDGYISHNADSVLKTLPEGIAKKECSQNMIEIISDPFEIVKGSIVDTLDKVMGVNEILEKGGMRLFPYGTYPGKFEPSIRKNTPYAIKEKLIGKERFKIAGRCIGFHCHYTLPKGIFDNIEKSLRLLIRSEIKKSMVDSYNMMIAMDPALITFLQSSPYYQGKYYGKDSRVMFYRGGAIFDTPHGLYSDFPEFGSLPQYTHSIFDIMHLVEERFRNWTRLVKKIGIQIKTLGFYGSALDTNWSPVKINPHGTLEQRSMDMNRFHLMTSAAVMIKFIHKAIHENEIKLEVNEIAINEPFRLEGNKVYVPPYSYVNTVLQREAALYGMNSQAIRRYCSGILGLSKKILPGDRKKFLKPFRQMVTKRTTVSDEIIYVARKMGMINENKISNNNAAKLALKLTDSMDKDIRKTLRIVKDLE